MVQTIYCVLAVSSRPVNVVLSVQPACRLNRSPGEGESPTELGQRYLHLEPAQWKSDLRSPMRGLAPKVPNSPICIWMRPVYEFVSSGFWNRSSISGPSRISEQWHTYIRMHQLFELVLPGFGDPSLHPWLLLCIAFVLRGSDFDCATISINVGWMGTGIVA